MSALDPLFTYLLRLGDDNLVLAQQLGALVSTMPELELDIAVANVCLDHLGQARYLLAYAAEVEGGGRDEDHLAMLRDERAFRNAVLFEQPNGDFAHTMARQFFVDAYQVPLYEGLATSADLRLATMAQKAAQESRYHLGSSSGWVVRLGDGTTQSRRRMQAAVNALWPFTADLFSADEVESVLVAEGIAVDPASLRPFFDDTVAAVLADATLVLPSDAYQRTGGRQGLHTELLGHLLPEMQSLYRAHRGVQW